MISGILAKRPEVVRLILAGRKDLALPRVELEVRGLATTLRNNQLRFTDEESWELIQAHADDAAKADMKLLQASAGGWAAALVLGARTLTSGSAHGDLATSFGRTDQTLLDFLLGEVFTTLPNAARRILLSTFKEPLITLPGQPYSAATRRLARSLRSWRVTGSW